MKKSIIRDLIILIAIFAVLWIGFTYIPFFKTPAEDVFSLSIANEEKLGKVITDAMDKDPNNPLESNPTLDSAMALVKTRLVNSLGTTNYEYHFKVIESPSINAFTLPGGNIYVYSGLINFCESPEELAAILAHEMGHAEKRHVVTKLAKELGVSILFTVISGGDGIMVGEIGRTALSTVFDREQEKEADDFSFALMEKAKLNPKAMATFMRRLNDKNAGMEKYSEHLELLMTHPNTNSRIKSSLEYKTAKDFEAQPFSTDWKRVKASLKKENKYEE